MDVEGPLAIAGALAPPPAIEEANVEEYDGRDDVQGSDLEEPAGPSEADAGTGLGPVSEPQGRVREGGLRSCVHSPKPIPGDTTHQSLRDCRLRALRANRRPPPERGWLNCSRRGAPPGREPMTGRSHNGTPMAPVKGTWKTG